MKNNIELFEYSLSHYDEAFDNPINMINDNVAKGTLVISEMSGGKNTPLMESNHELVDLITTYKTLKAIDNIPKEHIDRVVQNIIWMIENVEHINYTAFCQYFQVFGYSWSRYIQTDRNVLTNVEKIQLFSKILDAYIEYRHDLYFSYGYGDQSLQVISDSSSSKRLGKSGIERIEDILKDFKVSKNSYMLPDKGDKDKFLKFLKDNKIAFEFMYTHQRKMPDMLLLLGSEIFIIEHKEIRGSGGSQNHSIGELIDFIKQQERAKNVHYISMLQGDFMKMNLTSAESGKATPKVKKQYEDIKTALKEYESNYFLNGNGLKELLKNFNNF